MSEDTLKFFTLVSQFLDAQTQREIRVKIVISVGAATTIYSDAAFAKRAYLAAKEKGLEVKFLPRKSTIIELYPGKTMEQVKEYEMAILKQSGRKFKIK